LSVVSKVFLLDGNHRVSCCRLLAKEFPKNKDYTYRFAKVINSVLNLNEISSIGTIINENNEFIKPDTHECLVFIRKAGIQLIKQRELDIDVDFVNLNSQGHLIEGK
jgi:hypothetical protein